MAFRPEPSSSRTVVVPQRLVKSNRKSTAAPAPAPGPTPQQLELERLTTENARLSLAQTEASEGLAAAQEDLLVAQKREAALSDLMSSAGCDTVALGPLSWSIDSAQQLLDDEVATRRALQELQERISSGRTRTQELVAAQTELQQQLQARTA